MINEINDIDYTDILTKRECNQLKVFNRLNDFNKVYNDLIKKNKSLKKNDVLWVIYNEAKLEYENNKDLIMLSVVFDRQSDILLSDKKFEQSLIVFSASLYLILYEFDLVSSNIFDLHINKRRINKLIKILTKTNKTLQNFENEFEKYVQDYIPNLYNHNKAKVIIKNILKRIK